MIIDFVDIDKIIEDRRLDPYYYSPLFVNFYERIVKFECVNLGSLLKTITNGFDFREYSETGTPYIKVANVKQGEFDFSKIQYVTFNSFDVTKQIQLKEGNILLTRKGTFGYALYLNDNYDYVISSEVFNLDIKQDKINSKYLEIVLNSPIGQIQFDRNKIGAIMGSLSQEAVKQIKIPLPPKEIQQQIVDLYQRAVKEKQAKEQEATALLAGIDDYLLKELEIALPESVEKRYFEVSIWELLGGQLDVKNTRFKAYKRKSFKYNEILISEIASINKGKSITKDKIIDGNYPVIAGGQTSPYSHSEYNEIENSITISASGAYSGYVWFHDYKIFASDCSVVRSKDETQYMTEYIYLILKLKQDEIYRMQKGAGQPHVYSNDIATVTIPVLSIDKQQEIVKHIQSIRTKAKRLQEEANNELEKAKIEIEKMIIGG